jgi:DNA-binding SARP family transcriptional activator
LEISVLGPLIAEHDSMSFAPTAAKPRCLLALLASHEGRITPIEVIIAELWEDDPPPSALTTIQTYVLQLRRLIGKTFDTEGIADHPKDILRTQPGGYVLDYPGWQLDAAEYSQFASLGHEAFQTGDFDGAKTWMEAALALWHGPAYMDVEVGPRLSAHATLLEESRRTLLERRIAADLSLGRHHELIGELAGLTTEHATDERLHAHFMVALYRSGRRSQALGVFTRLRSTLATELGVDPVPDLDRLYRSMLSADPTLDPGASSQGRARDLPLRTV